MSASRLWPDALSSIHGSLSTQEGAVLQWIAEHKAELPTPMYLYDESRLNDCVASYRTLFPDDARGFYSLKANPQPALVQHFSSLGLGAELAGRGEWQLCDLAGILPSNILVGGVSKSEEFLSTLCASGLTAIVIESETEWRRLRNALTSSCQAPILLRINPGVSFGGLNMAGGSQFGLSVEQAIPIASEGMKDNRVDFLGLHFYFGSQRLEVTPIVQALETVENTIVAFQEAGIEIKSIDLGLGCGVPYLAKDQTLDVVTLRDDLRRRWCREPWSSVEVWFEAGRALVAEAGYFVARVVERKYLHGGVFVFLDGGLNVHNPGVGLGRFFQRNPRFCFITNGTTGADETVHIVGNLCTSADYLGRDVSTPKLEEGDLVVVPNAGAYCMTTALWGFNSQGMFFEGILKCGGSLNMIQPQHGFLTDWTSSIVAHW